MNHDDFKNVASTISDDEDIKFRDLEVEAAVSFIDKISNNFNNTTVKFHVCRLTDAVNQACMVDLDRRKILCLYLHNSSDKFSTIFSDNLKNMEVAETLNRSFFLLGWDIEEPKYQSALIYALNKCNDLSVLTDMLTSKVSAVLCIVPIKDSVTIFSCVKGKVSNKDFLVALTNAENFLIAENQEEKTLEDLAKKTGSENDMDSSNYQKLMADMLGDRDYDSFEHDQHEYLKKKISFAMLGPPQREDGYDKKDVKKINSIYETVLKNNNTVAKYKDRVEISFIYNCTEPLPSEKLSRAKKYKDEYNPNTDVMPLPIFVIRKCRGSVNPCRVFVDNTGRSYNSWQEYIRKNKLHKCQMILPQNGRYEVDDNGDVFLEKYLSPACGIDSKLLQGADYLNAAGGLISGGIFVAAAIPTVAVAPAAIVAGGIIGLGVGIYSLGRGAYTLYDRKKHKETLNFVNSEARGAYLNIVASSLGFVGAGATVLVSQLASMGVNIGQGASAAVRTIGFAKMSADSLSMLNAGCDMINNWKDENKASLLTIVQLRSSILFFGNVIYNFELNDVDLSEVKTLQATQESLRSNRHRKSFSKLLKKSSYEGRKKNTENLIDVISPIHEVQDKMGVHDVLLRSNDMLNDVGVNFSQSDNEISLNGKKVDVTTFSGISRKGVSKFLTYSAESEVAEETDTLRGTISGAFNNFTHLEIFLEYIINLLSLHSNDVKLKIIDILEVLLSKISTEDEETLDVIFPNQFKYFSLTYMIVSYFWEETERFEDEYQTWKNTQEEKYYRSIFEAADEDELKRTVAFFEHSVLSCYEGTQFTEQATENLLNHFYNWLAEHIYFHQIKTEIKAKRKEHSDASKTKKNPCNVCGGYYYQKT